MTVFPCRPTGKKLNCYISASAGVNRPLANRSVLPAFDPIGTMLKYALHEKDIGT